MADLGVGIFSAWVGIFRVELRVLAHFENTRDGCDTGDVGRGQNERAMVVEDTPAFQEQVHGIVQQVLEDLTGQDTFEARVVVGVAVLFRVEQVYVALEDDFTVDGGLLLVGAADGAVVGSPDSGVSEDALQRGRHLHVCAQLEDAAATLGRRHKAEGDSEAVEVNVEVVAVALVRHVQAAEEIANLGVAGHGRRGFSDRRLRGKALINVPGGSTEGVFEHAEALIVAS